MIWSFLAGLMSIVSTVIALSSGIYGGWAMTQLEKHTASWWLSDAVLFSSLCFLVSKGLSVFVGNQSDVTLTMWRVTFAALFLTSVLAINKGTDLGPQFLSSVKQLVRRAAKKVH